MENKENSKFSVRKRLRSFRYAFAGLKILFREEHNARIHLVVAIVVASMGVLLQISAMEWIVLCILAGIVFVLEIINSAIENLCDYISPEWQQAIKKVKDLMAAAVFITALTSVVCGIIIFLPKIFSALTGII